MANHHHYAVHHGGIEPDRILWKGNCIATTPTGFAKIVRKIMPPTLQPVLCTHRTQQDQLKHD